MLNSIVQSIHGLSSTALVWALALLVGVPIAILGWPLSKGNLWIKCAGHCPTALLVIIAFVLLLWFVFLAIIQIAYVIQYGFATPAHLGRSPAFCFSLGPMVGVCLASINIVNFTRTEKE